MHHKIIILFYFVLFCLYCETSVAGPLKPMLMGESENDQVQLAIFIPNEYGAKAKWKLFANSLGENSIIDEGEIADTGSLYQKSINCKFLSQNQFYLVIFDSKNNVKDFIVQHIKVKTKMNPFTSMIIEKGSLLIGTLFGFLLSIITFTIQEKKRELNTLTAETANFLSQLTMSGYEQLARWENTNRDYNFGDLINLNSINWYKLINSKDLFKIYQDMAKINSIWKINKNDDSHKTQLIEIITRIRSFEIQF